MPIRAVTRGVGIEDLEGPGPAVGIHPVANCGTGRGNCSPRAMGGFAGLRRNASRRRTDGRRHFTTIQF